MMAVDFPGVDEYLDCGSGANIDNLVSKTIAVWLRFDALPGNNLLAQFFNKAKLTVAIGWVSGMHNEAGTYKFYFYQTFTGVDGWWQATYSAVAGTWYHFAVTYVDNATTTDPIIYINGVSQTLVEATTPVGTVDADAAYNLTVGGDPDQGRWLDGQMEDARLFGRILSAQEVAVLASGYRGPLGGELVWLPMDGARAIAHFDGAALAVNVNYLNDLSGNANHGNPTGNPLGYASDCPRVGGITD